MNRSASEIFEAAKSALGPMSSVRGSETGNGRPDKNATAVRISSGSTFFRYAAAEAIFASRLGVFSSS